MTHLPTTSRLGRRARDERRSRPLRAVAAAAAACTCAAASLPVLSAPPTDPGWSTVAHSADDMPGSEGRRFNSFNQPSVNRSGLVVMRARSKGGSQLGEPVRGIYARKLGPKAGPIVLLMDNRTPVPQPNNTEYQGALGTFTEFPAFPRIAADGNTVLTRAQSRPVWTYTLPDGTESRVGTSGLYAHRLDEPATVMTQLGALPDFAAFSVPGAVPGTRFDQFPGAPANTGNLGVVFKGNYTDDGVPKTGVFYRTFDPGKPLKSTEVIASSDTLIPGQPVGGVTFGSTAPPSASNRDVVFLGLDNEQAPTLGGIYLAPLAPQPTLQALVTIGGPVPGEPEGTDFTRLGEALSFDGRFVGFWGGWGEATRTVTLTCPAEGQAAVVQACLDQHPGGTTTMQVPAAQGFFVHDVQSGDTHAVAKSGATFADFVYWTFSGRPPGVGESEAEDGEPPRWRSSAFVAVDGQGSSVQAVFKAHQDATASEAAADGLHRVTVSAQGIVSASEELVKTGDAATSVDPSAPAGASITALGLERDGLRGGWLAIAASMLDAFTSEAWAGVYARKLGK